MGQIDETIVSPAFIQPSASHGSGTAGMDISDDVSDGPVDAEVSHEGRPLAVEGAWVVCVPPNYAPDIISVQTLYDVIVDALNNLYIPVKAQSSFMQDIYALLQQLSVNQWVNQGFYMAYGYRQAYDFSDPELLRRLSTVTKNR